MYEYKEKHAKAVKCYRINEDGTKTKVVISAVRRKKIAIIIMATEQKDSNKPKVNIMQRKCARNEPLIFEDLERAEECQELSQKTETE